MVNADEDVVEDEVSESEDPGGACPVSPWEEGGLGADDEAEELEVEVSPESQGPVIIKKFKT